MIDGLGLRGREGERDYRMVIEWKRRGEHGSWRFGTYKEERSIFLIG